MIRILLAEDNPQDVFLLQEAFTNANLTVEIQSVNDGDELLKRLLREEPSAPPSIDLVLLDVRLPRRTAPEVLQMLRARRPHFDVPIVVLSSLISPQDRARFVELGTREVLSKPLDLEDYVGMAKTLYSFIRKDEVPS
jgi:CheY-like chemotaxis protein